MTTSLQANAHTAAPSTVRYNAADVSVTVKTVSRDGRTIALIIRSLLAIAFSYHALAITLTTMIPAKSHLHSVIDPAFRRYLTLTGSDQLWSMFHSAPYYASYDVVLVAEDRTGVRREYGPVLPGLRPYDAEGLRDHKVFGALTLSSYRGVLRSYFEAARQEIRARDGIEVRSLRLRYKTERLQSAKAVRKTGQISYSKASDSEVRRWRN
jgi:hypothetical protein